MGMSRTLYFDCFSGASGDMVLGALLDLGLPLDHLKRELGKLPCEPVELEIKRVNRAGISATKIDFSFQESKKHRHFSEIVEMIERSMLTDQVKLNALKIFRKLGSAEAKVHGIPLEKVHFHEVGALDSIMDIVGSCIGFDFFGITDFKCSAVNVGSGSVKMVHGLFPVPPPAVSELIKGIPIRTAPGEGELLTPTGAAIISSLCKIYGPADGLIFEEIGYGAGSKEFEDLPNALRLILGTTAGPGEASGSEELTLLETNLDDVSPEVLGYLMDRIFERGALDCWFTAIQMKKNRPATMVSVLCRPSLKEALIGILVTETPTLGVRAATVSRLCLAREVSEVMTKWGPVPVKVSKYKDKITNAKAEHDVMKEIARSQGIPLRDVEAEIMLCIDRLKIGRK